MCLISILVPAVPAATVRVNPGPANVAAVNVSVQVTHTIQPVITGRVGVITTQTTAPRVTIRETLGRVPAEIGDQVVRVKPTPTPSALPTIRKAGTDFAADLPTREIGNLSMTGNASGKGVVNLSGRDMKTAGPGLADLAPLDKDALINNEKYETQRGIENPVTGEVFSPDDNPGSALPGGMTMPGAEDRWNGRPGGAGGILGGGTDWVGEGTPFDDNPLGNPMDDFLNGHGGNLPDPMEAFGKGRSVISSAEGGDPSGGDYSYLICGSDFLSVENQKSGKDECIVIEVVGGEITKESWSDFKELSEVWDDSGSGNGGSGTQGQQYEGEGGYTGGTGGSANDLTFGGARRGLGGSGSGGSTDEDGLAQDTGGKIPVVLQKVGEYIAKGGKLHSKGGYQAGDSGLGSDTGAATTRISGLKKAIAAQRFVIDADATSAERVPWWLEKKVSPTGVAAVSQANAAAGAPADAAAAAQGAGQAQAQGQ